MLLVAERQNVTTTDGQAPSEQSEVNSNYCSGFRDCIKEVFHCLTNVEAMDLQQPCFQRLMCHLQAELQFLPLSAAKSNPLQDDNQKGNQQTKYPSTASNVDVENSPMSKSHETWQCKRSYDSISQTGTQQEASSSENSSPKRVHIDDSNEIRGGNGLYARGNELGSLDAQQSESNLSSSSPQQSDDGLNSSSTQGRDNSRKENPKVSMGTGSVWVPNGTPFSQVESSNAEKEKGLSSGSRSDKANVDGSGNEGPIGNNKLPNSGLDIPIAAIPISPRTPYIPNPYTTATYALHPSGTHYIPVLLHLNIPVPVAPPSSDMSGCSAPSGYMAAMNCMRMGGLQYPYVPYGMPFVPHVPGGVMGMNGIHNAMCKQESETQKQCGFKRKKEVDPTTTVDDENIADSVNVCSTTDKLY